MKKISKKDIDKLKVRPEQAKYEVLAKELLWKIAKGEIGLEEQPFKNDGIFEIMEYFGELNKVYVSVIRRKKINGINPRFIFRIETDFGTIDISGQIAAKAYHLASKQFLAQDEDIPKEDVDKILKMIG